MNYTLRSLDPTSDVELLREAYSWQAGERLDALQNARPIKFKKFAAKEKGRVVMGLFNGQLIAAYTIQEQEKGVFQVHFAAKRGAPLEALKTASLQLQRWLFDNGAIEVFGWIVRQNRPLKRFAESANFFYSGISCFQGTSRGEVVEWLRYVARK